MADAAELVNQFRGVVDQVIDEQVAGTEGRRFWPDMDKVARSADLTFMRYPKGQGSLDFVDLHEKSWAVVDDSRKLYGRAARLAIASLETRPNTLIRHWSLDSLMGGGLVALTTHLELTSEEELQTAVNWARSPHLVRKGINQLAVLTKDEEVAMKKARAQDGERYQDLQKGLEALRRTRERSVTHSPFRQRIR